MIAITHIVFALFFYFIFLKISSFSFSTLIFLAIILGSVFPDVDATNSWLNRQTGFTKIFSLVKHRGFFHSLFGLLLFSSIGILLFLYLGLNLHYIFAFSSGYFMHLVADSLTVTGIRWFWKKGHLKWKIKTATFSEGLFFLALLLISFFVFNKEIKEFKELTAELTATIVKFFK